MKRSPGCGNIDCSGTASGTYFCKDIYGQDFSVLYLIYILKSDVSLDSLYEENIIVERNLCRFYLGS